MAVNFPNNPTTNQTHTHNGLTWKYDGTTWILQTTMQAGATTFTGLTDTPSNYTGQAGKWLKVNSTPDGLEFTDEPTGTDTTYELKTNLVSSNVNLKLDADSGTDDNVLITAGSNITFSSVTEDGFTISASSGTATISDGDYGDITVSNTGSTWMIDDDTVGPDELKDTSVTAGSYTNTSITVDAQGRITSASTGSATPLTLGASVTDIFDLPSTTLNADDPGADRIVFWDDSSGKLTHLSLGTNLSITGTTLNSSSGSGGLTQEEVEDVVGAMFSGNTETRITVEYADNGSSPGKINLVVDDMNDSGLTQEEVEDIVGAMFSGNTETRITAEYADNGSSDGKINLVVDDMTGTDTTYELEGGGSNGSSFGTGTGTINLKTGGSVQDTVTLTAGSNIKIDNTGASGFTISADTGSGGGDGNTTYAISCDDGDVSTEEKIVLTGSNPSSTDEIVLAVAGTGLSIGRSGDKITITGSGGGSGPTTEEIQDIVGAMFSGNTETRITATYEDGDGTIDLVVDDMSSADQDVFKNIAVSGQTTVVADNSADTLTLVAGTNMTITTNASNDSITFTSTASGGDGNTTYDIATIGNSNQNSMIKLFGTDNNDSAVVMTGTGGITVVGNTSGATKGTMLTFDGSGITGTTYDFYCSGSSNPVLRLDPSTGANDDVTIKGGTDISVTRNSNTELEIAYTGSGGGGVAGSDHDIQYNNNGSMGGAARLHYHDGDNTLDFLHSDLTQKARYYVTSGGEHAIWTNTWSPNSYSQGVAQVFKNNGIWFPGKLYSYEMSTNPQNYGNLGEYAGSGGSTGSWDWIPRFLLDVHGNVRVYGPGSHTYTPNLSLYQYFIIMLTGGGGSGGEGSSTAGGGGGGAGGTSIQAGGQMMLGTSASASISVGSGGAASSSGNGNNGGNSTVSTNGGGTYYMTALGGGGGIGNQSSINGGGFAGGCSCSNSVSVLANGAFGGVGHSANYLRGFGGPSFWGGPNGQNFSVKGAPGSGGTGSQNGSASQPGGDGCCVIIEF